MSSNKGKKYSEKHQGDARPNPAIEKEIEKRLKNNTIPCAVVFDIAGKLNAPPIEVGKTADLLNVSLSKCQLGLFGYTPDKKIVKAESTSNRELLDAIDASLENDRLPCASAWEIAARFSTPKLKIGNICEGRGIKIKPCQLGAF